MASQRMKNPRLKKGRWKTLPYKPSGKKEPLVHGQELMVKVDDGEHRFIPCFPKPGEKNQAITRIPNMEWITYVSLLEFDGQDLMEFQYKGTHVLVGLGALPFLVNIPAKRTKYGAPKKKKRGAPKSSIKNKKPKSSSPHKRRRENNHMKKAPLPEPKRS